jgi:hypothetical protein
MAKLSTMAAAIATLGLVCSGGAYAGTMDSVVNIKNNTSWEIHQIFLSPVDEENWGENLLGLDVVQAKGGSVEVRKIACDTYDVRLVDEDGAVCIVGGVKLCANQDAWEFDDEDLLACQAATKE